MLSPPCCGTLGTLLTLSGLSFPVDRVVLGRDKREMDRTIFLEVAGQSFFHASCVERHETLAWVRASEGVSLEHCVPVLCASVCVHACVHT